MKLHRILILIGAAWAGSMVYNARHAYENLTGSGSLGKSLQEARAKSQTKESKGPNQIDPNEPAYTENPYFTKILIKPREKPELEHNDDTLLNAAASGDKAKVIKQLNARTKVDSRDNERHTPLMLASANGYNDICGRLLAAGANPEFRDRDGNNAFDHAAGRGLIETTKFLLERSHTRDDRYYIEYATLINAALTGDVMKMPEGTDTLVSINRINPAGQSPLHIAAGNGLLPLIKALIERGARVDISYKDRQTPLHWAAWNNQTQALELLLAYGADITKADLGGNTALMLAAQNNSKEAVRLLVAKGADKYATNKQGKTAFILAEDIGYRDMLPLLK